MKIEYVCHACLLIDTGDVRIATDPWYYGPAYCNQWHVFPKPVNANVLDHAEFILVSHGHEDHLHEPTLRQLPKNASVFYPYTWCSGTPAYLTSIGFTNVTEAGHLRKYHLTQNTSVTYVINSLDSIMVIESNGEVFVNVNDALHSSPRRILDAFVDEIKRRWPRIDTVFCGFGGASYFPNTIHCHGKNDVEIGEAREELFARNFCHIVKQLNPAVAVPFAADFALLGAKQRWINEVRFPRVRLPEYFNKLYRHGAESPRIEIMYSGDVLENSELIEVSPYRIPLERGDVNGLIDRQYACEIVESGKELYIDEPEADRLTLEILQNVRMRKKQFDPSILAKISYSVKARDVQAEPYFNVRFVAGEPLVERSSVKSNDSILVLETTSRILRYSFGSEWGGDAMTIGYGCEIEVFDAKTITANLDTICVRLLTRHPTSSSKLEPLRWLRHRWNTPVELSEYRSNALNDITRETLFRPKCEVCRACDYVFSEQNPTEEQRAMRVAAGASRW
jgi:hypothetical protein